MIFETNKGCARHRSRAEIMNRITVLLLSAMLFVATYGQTESDATAIAKINLELCHIELKSD